MANNDAAFRMVEGRLSAHVKTFNAYDVSGTDSDDQYFLSTEKVALAKAALNRAPAFKVTTLARSLGDVYRAIKTNMTNEELTRWNAINEELEALCDKYNI